MEIMLGKQAQSSLTAAVDFNRLLSDDRECLIDLGTGDGRFVLQAARNDPALFAIGVDACRENLRETIRSAPVNALFIIANACTLPAELTGLASRLTINFPWGSLLTGLLEGSPTLLQGLIALARPRAGLEVRLNASALAEAGWELNPGADQVYRTLADAGFRLRPPRFLTAVDLRAYPTTWAKRLAYGRRPEAVYLRGQLP